ncbi:MAG: ABC transporter ATP-binding protein [Clostridiales bacterium]|nr:ABC transporter ATP-binding protein [Clostridiales bacterium]
MEETYAIEVEHISKHFKIFLDKGHEIKDYVTSSRRRKYENREVLKDISFKVKKGEAIGLIGHNGCGKSTTLKLLTKIMYPDSGTITMRGRVSSLIELGAGFHPDMSGRENIYINASIFGLTKKEIDRRLDDIIAFSELEEFIDNPVRTYSSGMYMRLAFAVAINVDADILLIDEILAVGDVNFQSKCFNRLREIKAEGTTIVIVSHSLGQIEQICERSIWIHEGVIKAEGRPRDIHPEYLDFMGGRRQEHALKEKERREAKKAAEEKAEIADNNIFNANSSSLEEQNHVMAGNQDDEKENDVAEANVNELAENSISDKDAADNSDEPEKKANLKRWGNGHARIQRVRMLDTAGNEQSVFKTGANVSIQIEYSVNQKVEDAVFGIGIFRSDGLQCYGTNTRIDKIDRFNLNKGGITTVRLDKLNLISGEYTLDVAIECDQGVPIDYYREAYRFEVFSNIGDVGVARVDHEWTL